MSEETEEKTYGIGGKKREGFDNTKHVGLAEVKVVCINPNAEEYKDILGIELKEESKATEYLGESKEGNNTVRIDVWVEAAKLKGKKDKITFFLEDKLRENKEATKRQYINNLGSCSWADDPNNLPEWFTKRDYREAYNGEEDLYNFLRGWLSFDYTDPKTILSIEWKALMKGNIKEIKMQIGSDIPIPFGALYTVKTVIKEGEDNKEYQSIYNRAFTPAYSLKNFRLVDYDNKDVIEGLEKKKSKDLKPYERFVLSVKGEYGCKDSYILKDIKEYSPDDFLVASDKPIMQDDMTYES